MYSPISSHNPDVFTVNLNVQINGREYRRSNYYQTIQRYRQHRAHKGEDKQNAIAQHTTEN
jgi:fatty acid-binding protein DegV